MEEFQGYLLRKTDGSLGDLPSSDTSIIKNFRVNKTTSNNSPLEVFRYPVPIGSIVKINVRNVIATDATLAGHFSGEVFNTFSNKTGGAVRGGSVNGLGNTINTYSMPTPSFQWITSSGDAILNFLGKNGSNMSISADIDVYVYPNTN